MHAKIELLAPVGSYEALEAAIENGADAVYLGGKLFNARQYASNFENEELIKAIKYAHVKGVKVYVTINILLRDEELKDIIDYLIFLYNIDVDAIIVQDLGLVRVINELFKDFEIHASTQMTINNSYGVNLLEDFGFKRVVLARELSLDEIKYIKNNTNLELEGFIHGALCISYSGQCLMSSLLGGRSGNRGRCAQTCRMPYSIIKLRDNKLFDDKFNDKYLLSPKDLNTIDYIEEVVKSGLDSLKIEGRMKRPEYVSIIVSNYSKALNILDNKKNEELTKKDKEDIVQIFNRGFTKGHILNERFNNFISYDKPNNRGTFLGDIIRIDKRINILLKKNLRKGDGIEIRDNGFIVDKLYKNGIEVDFVKSNDIAQIDYIKGVRVNDKVYKTKDIELLGRALEKYKNKKKIGIFMNLKIFKGEKIKLSIWDESYNTVFVESDFIPEDALKVSLNYDSVYNQINKLGDTIFYLKKLELNLSLNTMVPKSILNKIRREGIEKLYNKLAKRNKRIFIKKEELNINDLFNYADSFNSLRKLSVRIRNIKQFKKLNIDKLDRVYLDYNLELLDVIKELKSNNKEVYLSTSKIISDDEFNSLKKDITSIYEYLDGISVSNLGTLKFIKDNFNINIHTDIGINIFNSSTIKLLNDFNVKSFTYSPELNLSQLRDIKKGNLISEVIGYGRLPVMISKYCPFSIAKNCYNEDCENCSFKEGYGLIDRKRMVFPVIRDKNNSIILNSVPLFVLEHINEIYKSGIDMIRLDFTIEENIKEIQELYYDYVNKLIDKRELEYLIGNFKENNKITKGHFFRGVL